MLCTTRHRRVALVACLAVIATAPTARAQIITVTAGANLDADFNEVVEVPYAGFAGAYFLQVNLVHNPSAGPMFKNFQSPVSDTGAPILLDALQPFPQPLWEDFQLIALPGIPTNTPVADWHEEIFTDGWEWVLPGDDRFPDLFSEGQSLINRNGEPYPWHIPPHGDAPGPNQVWAAFPAITQDNTLGIHKALLWVGTDGNRVWGDDQLDDGTPYDESSIRVWEYPTIPEPGTLSLALIAASCAMLGKRRRA
ncbi:MAG: hypothetical protein R3C10_01520 [Pirellulales bacterium]